MTNNDTDPPEPVVQAGPRPQDEPFPRVLKGNSTDTSQRQPPNPPETPTPPPCNTSGPSAPELVPLPEKYQTTVRHIHTLESHNTKLYEDNCRLVNAVNMLNDRLAFFGAPHNAQVLRLADMQERLRTSEANRMSVNRKYQDLLQSVSAGSGQHHIIGELQAMRDAYASLDREYRLLGDKYVRLKSLVDANRVAQPHRQDPHLARGPVQVARSEFRAYNQGWNDFTSPTAVVSSDPSRPFLDQRGDHRRRSSGDVMTQLPLRSGTTPITAAHLAPLPTPPPSAPLPGRQISSISFPVHAQVPVGSLPLLRHAQMVHDPTTLPGPSAVAPPRHLAEKGISEQLNAAIHLRQCSGEVMDMASRESVPCSAQTPAPASSRSSPCPLKRPNSELQTSASPGGERKKARIEGETDCSATINADTCPVEKMPSSPASTGHHSDHKLSVSSSDVRSYQDCVNLIFEKDANIEDGVFCGLCLDRYEAKMVPEPPDILLQPDFDFLVRHCMTMHPTVWDDLRRKA